jgi:hypothetical protein
MLGGRVGLAAAAVTRAAATAQPDAPPGVLVSGHFCDVSDEEQVLRFRDELLEHLGSAHGLSWSCCRRQRGSGATGIAATNEAERWTKSVAVDHDRQRCRQ